MQINRDNLKWLGRMALILVLVVAADVLVVLFVRKPLPWVALIPLLIPLLNHMFVLLPLQKAGKLGRPTA